MKTSWYSTVLPIAALFSFRMLGLFMLIPVFTVLATQLTDANPFLIGIALGGYGLSQGLLQIPFGMLSDHFGRKPVITLGLVLFIIGSLLGAFTHSIYGMIAARILQGMGAIGAVLIALMADLTAEKERTKSMAVIGMIIGLSFSLALVLSPAITQHYGLSGIFYLTATLGFAGLMLLYWAIPTPVQETFHPESETNPKLLTTVLKDKTLLSLDFGIFFQHFILTATFYVIPLLLQQQIAEGQLARSWHFYLPLMLLSFVLMMPLIVLSERKKKSEKVFVLSISLILFSQLMLSLMAVSLLELGLLMLLYFIAFNFLEASLPSFISRKANQKTKGTALGVYSTCQFSGIFGGGLAAGFIMHESSYQMVFLTNAVLGFFWLILSIKLPISEKI